MKARLKEDKMHYRNGREAKAGDQVVGLNVSGDPVGGTLVDLKAETDTCNGNVILTGAPKHCVTIKDCLHVDDMMAANVPALAAVAAL